MSLNFVIFWALPIMGMGSIYKFGLKWLLQPIYLMLEQNAVLRSFASSYIYTKPEHADFFVMSCAVLLHSVIGLSIVFTWQLVYGHLPMWLIFSYYCSWVGIGGNIMGAAYSLAHKEGHFYGLYRKWLRSYVGHIFENWVGVFFGSVPWNFTTSHIYIHHRLDGGIGDTFYEWDLDRSKPSDFMLYVHRIFTHMIGYSSIKFFYACGPKSKADQLEQGIKTYCTAVIAVLAITRSPSFVFWIILQPLLCMSYFLALINYGFHGFIEFDKDGKHIPTVNATCIVDGEDDLFGEDDHMAHHYSTSVYYRDLPALQKSKEAEYARTKASIFQKVSVVELSIYVLFGLWDRLAEYYVDYSGKMTREEIMALLKERAQRTEINYDDYQEYLNNPTLEARQRLLRSQSQSSSLSKPFNDSLKEADDEVTMKADSAVLGQ